ncbi:hypothetical protein GMORB2_5599 [Geosmithia morbida]|uniref:Uncharacterized protein n=1 Tax=Geosmithia morbida TaxID=1094350 RepID=A0A9P4YY88_9HYPO|nr:uncharacterized protein GMORB2_5599 [Geosmithia morbida]KAF4123883.1 hypothetical protein GMORB2_5599 [Geosmithia morbida]
MPSIRPHHRPAAWIAQALGRCHSYEEFLGPRVDCLSGWFSWLSNC